MASEVERSRQRRPRASRALYVSKPCVVAACRRPAAVADRVRQCRVRSESCSASGEPLPCRGLRPHADGMTTAPPTPKPPRLRFIGVHIPPAARARVERGKRRDSTPLRRDAVQPWPDLARRTSPPFMPFGTISSRAEHRSSQPPSALCTTPTPTPSAMSTPTAATCSAAQGWTDEQRRLKRSQASVSPPARVTEDQEDCTPPRRIVGPLPIPSPALGLADALAAEAPDLLRVGRERGGLDDEDATRRRKQLIRRVRHAHDKSG